MKPVFKCYKVSVAGKSLKITIPPEFVKKENVKKGDLLYISYYYGIKEGFTVLKL